MQQPIYRGGGAQRGGGGNMLGGGRPPMNAQPFRGGFPPGGRGPPRGGGGGPPMVFGRGGPGPPRGGGRMPPGGRMSPPLRGGGHPPHRGRPPPWGGRGGDMMPPQRGGPGMMGRGGGGGMRGPMMMRGGPPPPRGPPLPRGGPPMGNNRQVQQPPPNWGHQPPQVPPPPPGRHMTGPPPNLPPAQHGPPPAMNFGPPPAGRGMPRQQHPPAFPMRPPVPPPPPPRPPMPTGVMRQHHPQGYVGPNPALPGQQMPFRPDQAVLHPSANNQQPPQNQHSLIAQQQQQQQHPLHQQQTRPPQTLNSVPVQAPAASATSASGAFTKEQTDQAWSEHDAPNGMKYYYNSISKESTFCKPDALKAQETATHPASNTGASGLEWKEYQDPSSGKTYYSNGVTTTWEKPAGLASTPTITSASSAETDDVDHRKKKKRKLGSSKETEFNNKEEAIAAFKGLLLAKDIGPTLKWNEVVKICSSDGRWEACEQVLSNGERKQAFAEYKTKRANELRDLERQERARAKDMFVQLLTEVLPTLSNGAFSAWNSRFSDVRSALSTDDRFHAVADEATRESLFLDFCEEFRKRDERKKRNKRRESHDAFLSFLRERAEDPTGSGKLTYASTWKSFISSLADADRSDSRFVLTPDRNDQDRQVYFADFVIELQAAEDDKRRRIRDAEQRAEQEQRDAYLASLSRLAQEGKLLPASRWRNVEEQIASLPAYGPVHAQDREAPRELFQSFCLGWNEIYRRDRTFLSQLVYPSAKSDAMVKSETTYDDFTKGLLERASAESKDMHAEARRIIQHRNSFAGDNFGNSNGPPVSSARLYFNELSLRSRGLSGPSVVRRGSSSKGGAASMRKEVDSSSDEGEIIEDGELLL